MRILAQFLFLLTLLALVGVAQPTVVRSFAAPAGAFMGGLGYDTVTDQLYVCDSGATTGVVYVVNRSTGKQVSTITIAGGTNLIGAGVDPNGRLLYIADEKTTNGERIWTYDLKNSAVVTVNTVSPANSDISGLDYNPITNTIVTSADGPALIVEFDLNMKVLTSLSLTGLSADADGLGSNTFNGLYLVGDDTGQKIIEIADDGYVMNNWSSTKYGIQDPEGVTMDPKSGRYFIITTVSPPLIYEVAGGVTPGPALTTDKNPVPKGQPVTFSLRTDPQQWRFGGMALVALGGGSLPVPVILANTFVSIQTGKVTFAFPNPGLGGIKATLIGAAYSTTGFQVSNVLDVILN